MCYIYMCVYIYIYIYYRALKKNNDGKGFAVGDSLTIADLKIQVHSLFFDCCLFVLF